MYVPSYSRQICLTLYMRGQGDIWFDGLDFEIVDDSIPEKYDHLYDNSTGRGIKNLP